jgi:hypothetical protein
VQSIRRRLNVPPAEQVHPIPHPWCSREPPPWPYAGRHMERPSPDHTTRQVSVTEASRELGVSAETVRRWIKSGRLQAERAIRPQGAVWVVSLPVTTPRGVAPVTVDATLQTPHDEGSDQEPAPHIQHPTPDVASHPSSDPTPHYTSDPHLTASIARLIVELVEVRIISDRRADQLVAQAERVAALERETGRLTAKLVAERAARATLEAHTAPPSASVATEPPATRRRAWWRAWLAVGLAVVVVGSVSCQTSSPFAAAPTVCAAARQHIMYFEGVAKRVQPIRPNSAWLETDDSTWERLMTVGAFLKTYC